MNGSQRKTEAMGEQPFFSERMPIERERMYLGMTLDAQQFTATGCFAKEHVHYAARGMREPVFHHTN